MLLIFHFKFCCCCSIWIMCIIILLLQLDYIHQWYPFCCSLFVSKNSCVRTFTIRKKKHLLSVFCWITCLHNQNRNRYIVWLSSIFYYVFFVVVYVCSGGGGGDIVEFIVAVVIVNYQIASWWWWYFWRHFLFTFKQIIMSLGFWLL